MTVTDPEDPTDVERVDATRSKSSLTATVLAYPSATGSFFFRAGLGVGSQEVSAEIQGLEVSASEDFVAADLGVGHDFQLGGGNLYLTPEVAAMLHAPDAEISATDATFLLVVGIGFR